MGFAVVVDSTLDMSAEEYQALNITMVPLNILVGEDEFKDQVEISSEEFYKRMSEAAELQKPHSQRLLILCRHTSALRKRGL